MFSNLKRKLNYAMQEGSTITENLQQQYRQRVPTSKSPTSSNNSLVGSTSELGLPSNINVSAGCKLLSKYEDDWQALHQNNEENSKKAAVLAGQIENIEQKMFNHQIIMTDLLTCLAGLPNLIEKLQSCRHTLTEVQELHKMVEKDFEKLQDLKDLELFRQKLALEQEQRIRNHEVKLQQIQKERQAVFEDAFQYDLLEYKRTGQVTKIPIGCLTLFSFSGSDELDEELLKTTTSLLIRATLA
uniref:Dysbindin n=1 Tax=Glossina brevipalpis TaxID=37001 RepID=A0A1A9X0C6_9MUSC